MSFSIDGGLGLAGRIALGECAAQPYIWLEMAEIQSGRFHERPEFAELKASLAVPWC
jgi:hypothetical protein